MDEKIVFLSIVIFLTFLSLILSNVFLEGQIDFGTILILLLIYVIAYGFIYKFRNFQKVLFILSTCSFVFFISSLYGYWFFNSYIPLLTILNWYIIWLISKNEGKYLRENSFVLIGFIFYSFFNLALIFSPYSDLNPAGGLIIWDVELSIWGILGICLLSLSVIFSIIFVVTVYYDKYFSLSDNDMIMDYKK